MLSLYRQSVRLAIAANASADGYDEVFLATD
jgi:hypothetical protein